MSIDDTMKQYTPYYKNDIYKLIEWVEIQLDEYETSLNLYHTDCLCKCFLTTILEMTKGAFGSLQERSIPAFYAIYRSIWEHTIDLRFIVTSNDEMLNRRFANYYKIILYRIRDKLGISDANRTKIQNEYRKYILDEFAEELDSDKFKDNSGLIINWKKIDKHFTRNSWSRISFADRVDRISKLTRDQLAPSTNTNESRIDPFVGLASHFWKIFSSYIHPTPFGTVPHFEGKDGTFKLKYDYSDEKLLEKERIH